LETLERANETLAEELTARFYVKSNKLWIVFSDFDNTRDLLLDATRCPRRFRDLTRGEVELVTMPRLNKKLELAQRALLQGSQPDIWSNASAEFVTLLDATGASDGDVVCACYHMNTKTECCLDFEGRDWSVSAYFVEGCWSFNRDGKHERCVHITGDIGRLGMLRKQY
jgi:hypothetical protein